MHDGLYYNKLEYPPCDDIMIKHEWMVYDNLLTGPGCWDDDDELEVGTIPESWTLNDGLYCNKLEFTLRFMIRYEC